MEKISSTL